MKKRVLSLLLAIVMLFGVLPMGAFSASAADFASEMRSKGFPGSYIPYLQELHNKYPKWKFEPLETKETWAQAIEKERTPHSKQVVQMTSSNDKRNFYCQCPSCYKNGNYVIQEGKTWVAASQKAVEYYMDPRESLDEKYIFQFETIYSNKDTTQAGVEAILAGTWMQNANITYKDANGKTLTYSPATKYSKAIMDAANKSGISAYYLASKIVQEVGGKTPTAGGASGTYPGYEGIYNYYNIRANTGAKDGLAWASTTSADYKTNCNANLRSKPSSNDDSAKLVLIPNNTKLTYLGTTATQPDGYKWYNVRVTISGKTYTGYVRSDLVDGGTADIYNRPWTNPYLSIVNGAVWIANNFKTQNTGYLQKFNVNPASGSSMHNHEYMANVQAASTEAVKTYNAYKAANVLSSEKTFVIPVFKDMPNSYLEYSSDIPAVTGVTPKPYGNAIWFKWNAVDGASGYEIERLENGNVVAKGRVTSPSATFKSLEPGKEYTFRVRAFTVSGLLYTFSTNYSQTIKVKTLTTEQATSTMPEIENVKLTNVTASSVDVSFDGLAYATIYRVQILKDGVWRDALKTTAIAETSATITGLDDATQYKVRVVGGIRENGVQKWGKSWSESEIFYTKPIKVLGINTLWRSAAGDSLKLSWEAQPKADGFKIYQRVNGNWQEIATITGGTVTEYKVENLKPGTNYEFAMRAYKGSPSNLGGWGSAYATYTAENIEAALNQQVKNVKAQTTWNSAQISFDRLTGVDGYEIQLRTAGGAWKHYVNTNNSDKVWTGFPMSEAFEMRVRAYKGVNGQLVYSDVWSEVTAFSTKPPIVSNINTSWRSAAGDSLKLSWEAQPKADGFKIYQRVNGNWQEIATITGGTVTEYKVENLKPGTNYEFAMRAYKGSPSNLGGWGSAYATYTAENIEAALNQQVKNVKAQTTWNSAQISFDRLTGVDGYEIQLRTAGGAWKHYVNTNNSDKVWTGFPMSEAFEMRVRAYKGVNGQLVYSDVWSEVTAFSTKPPIVSNINTSWRSAAGDSLKLSWEAQPKADGFKIYQRVNGSWKEIATITGGTVTEYKVENLKPGTNYEFAMRAYKGSPSNLGGWGNAYATYTLADISVALSQQVKNVKAQTTADSIRITFDRLQNVDGYEIQLRTEGGDWKHYVNTNNSDKVWTGFPSSTKYEIRVRAYKSVDGSLVFSENWSNAVTVFTKLPKVTGLEAYYADDNNDPARIVLVWDVAENADGYNVCVREAGTDDEFECICTTSSKDEAACMLSGLMPGEYYEFAVNAFLKNPEITGDFSESFYYYYE